MNYSRIFMKKVKFILINGQSVVGELVHIDDFLEIKINNDFSRYISKNAIIEIIDLENLDTTDIKN